MPQRICCSISNRFLTFAFCLISLYAAPMAWAQRSYGHAAGGTTHISAPPIYHVPAAAPVFRAPISSSRMSSMRSAGGFGSFRFPPPRRPIRPFLPVFFPYGFPFIFGGPLSGFNCWFASCDLFWPGIVDYATISSPGPVNYVSPAYEAPVVDYADYGEEAPEMPQLYLKDGSVLNVADYWLVSDQLHFTIIQEYGAQPTEEVIPFEALDLQKTVDVNTRRGFRFMLRNEPVEQYVRDHPEGPPPTLTPHP
jgi:hypothetical protein